MILYRNKAKIIIPRYMLKSINALMQKTNNAACLAMMMMMDFLRCKKRRSKAFCNLIGVTKLIIHNERDIIVRTCEKILGEISPSVWHVKGNFESNRSLIKKFMIKRWWKRRWGNSHGKDFKEILSYTIIDKRTVEVLDPKVDSTYRKDKF